MSLPATVDPYIKLRPYQMLLVDELRQAYRDDLNPCLVLPTGGGKTVISGGLAGSSSDRDRKLWFVCHRDFLVDQTSKTFSEMGIPHGILAAGYPCLMQPTMVVSVDTLRARLMQITDRPDVMVWDECHHTPSTSWRAVWEWAGPDCFHMGLTATPQRLDGKGLAPEVPGKPGFERLIIGPSVLDLMAWGNLSGYVAYAPNPIDLTGIKKTAGDYNRKQLKKAVTAQVIVGDIVDHYLRRAAGKRMIYFCVSVEYSKNLAAEFSKVGYRAQHLDARDSTDARRWAAQQFATGKLDILTNVGLFVEGYDLAAQAGMDVTVEGVGLVRPTSSEALAIQQMGRCLRPKADKAIIIDHAGICEAHGLPDTDRDWTLIGKGKAKPKSMVKSCPSCLAVIKITAQECPHCGHDFRELVAHRIVKQVEGVLEKVDAETFNKRRRSYSKIVGQCKTLEDFQRAAAFLGYKPGWAFYAHREKQQYGFVRRRGSY